MAQSDAPRPWLTPVAHARLTDELEDLVSVGRKDVTEQIRIARAHGDLSENGDYHAAKERQGLMEARIRELQALLRAAVVREADAEAAVKVQVGSVVTIRRASSGSESEYLVGSAENRGLGVDVVSPESPLGSALLGHSAGDDVEYDAPVGKIKVSIVGIRSFDG